MILHPNPESFHAGTAEAQLETMAKDMGEFDFVMLLHSFAADQSNLCKAAGNHKAATTWRAMAGNAETLARASA